MRIIAGKYRHRIINYPGDPNITRPTKDRVRESIFNALGDIDSFVSLDLYAGSGSMGIESLSRGCSFSYFSDTFKEAIDVIKKNVETLAIPDNNYVISLKSDKEMVDYLANFNVKVDLVFLDPPYKFKDYQEIIDLLINKSILKDNAIIVVEANRPLSFNGDFKKIKEYKYGEILVYIIWR